MVMTVRTNVDPLTLQRSIVAAIRGVSRDQGVTDVRTVERIKEEVLASRTIPSVLLGTFSIVALLLAGIGIYGVISYSVAQRTREIGIRAALGASNQNLTRLLLDRGIVLTVIGLVLGVGGALALTRLMASLLFGVGARDPLSMVSMAALLAGVAVVASYVPARRATRVDPIVALRYE
jgi:putative ABC transport system permease protein